MDLEKKIDELIEAIQEMKESNNQLGDRVQGFEIGLDELDQRILRIEDHLGMDSTSEVVINDDFGYDS